MLKRTNHPNHDPSAVPKDGNSSNSFSLLAAMGKDAKIEGKFDIADSIEIECEIGGETNSLVISKGGFFNDNVVKLKRGRGREASGLPREREGPSQRELVKALLTPAEDYLNHAMELYT